MKTLREIFLLNEEIRLSEDSVDSQIDSILLGYQGSTVKESYDGKLNYHFSLLLEAPPEGGNEEMPDNMDNSETSGDDEMQSDEPSDPKVEQIQIDEFAQKVYNLLTNYKSLLNIEPVIINRAKKALLESGYDQNTLAEFEEILDREFGVSLDGEKEEVPARPVGGSAGPIV